MKGGNSEMCGIRHLFAGPGKYCQDCGHLPDDDCHLKIKGKSSLQDLTLEYMDDDHYKITGFITDEISIEDNYFDYGRQVEIPGGFWISLIMIELRGKLKVEGIRLLSVMDARMMELIPRSVLMNRPIAEPDQIYIPFPKTLDTRMMNSGDLRLGFTIKDYEAGDKLILNYQTSMILHG